MTARDVARYADEGFGLHALTQSHENAILQAAESVIPAIVCN